MSDQVWWYATRAAGLMTWATAVAAVIVGLLLSTRVAKKPTGPWLLDLHRFLGGISVLFLVVHMGALSFDSFVDFGPRELLIPGESTWNTEAAAWGIIAAFTLILVEVTSLLRKWINPTVWRMFHAMSIITVAAGSYHAWLGGSDIDNPLTWVIAGAASIIVALLVGVRLRRAAYEDRTTTDRLSREALLREMRERLEGLAVSDTTTEAELRVDGASSLPRRTAGANPLNGALPLPGQLDILTPRATPTAQAPPPAVDDAAAPEPVSPFDRAPIDLFGTPSVPPSAPSQPQESNVTSGQQAPDPFLRRDNAPTLHPAPHAFEAQPADEPSPADVSSPFGSRVPGPTPTGTQRPPPLPEGAIDPVTGEPDQAAYQAWLIEWLAYADTYGEETPDDPSRV